MIKQHAHHQERDDLAGEHRFGDTGQLILLFLFLGIWTVDALLIKSGSIVSRFIPLWIRIPVSIAFLAGAYVLTTRGMRLVFYEKREVPAVIRSGVFRLMRHPIYSGCMFFYVALWFLTLSLLTVPVLLLTGLFYWYISRTEETRLIGKFGEAYIDYQKQVPMFFPRLKH
jgi:protein-S-isoprenylcysteine O-methyltransferase Ste14